VSRTAIVPTDLAVTGAKMAPVAGIADGHMFANDGRTFVRVANADAGGAHTVTFQTAVTVEGLAVTDRAVSIPASDFKVIGPFDRAVYNQQGGADDGMVYVDYENGLHASFTIEVYRLP
jgi:hypothetical protein